MTGRALRRRTRVLVILAQLATVGGLLLVWQGASPKTTLYVSTPRDVASQLRVWVAGQDRRDDLLVTFKEAAVGGLLAIAVGIGLAAFVASSAVLTRLAAPFLGAFNALPKIALAPLFIVAFGIDFRARVIFVAASLFFIPFFAVLSAVRAIDPALVRNVVMLGGGRARVVWNVHVPAMLSAVAVSLRVVAAWSLLATIVSEVIVSNEGIGHVIKSGQQTLSNDIVLSGVLVVASVAFVVDRLLSRLEGHLTRWRRA